MKQISPTLSRIFYGNRPLILANGIDGAAIKIRVKNTDNEPMADMQAEFVADRDGVELVQPTLTNNEGSAVGYVKATTIGPVTLRVRVLNLPPNLKLSTPEALQELAQSSAGAVWLEDTLTINFYDRDIDPKPTLAVVSERNIHVQWSVSRHFMNDIDGIRVRIEADDATAMPTKIFAYQMLPVRPGSDEQVATFDHVCSSVDLEEYPEDEAIPGSRPAWLRTNYVDVFLRSREEVRAFVANVLEDVQILKNTLDIADDLLPGGEVWIGAHVETE
jgi:hypothetical protein